MVIGGFERYDSLREELLVLLAWTFFCGFLFLVGIEKNALIWYKAYVLHTSYIEEFLGAKTIIDS